MGFICNKMIESCL